MPRVPSINQAVIIGQIADIQFKSGGIFSWNFDVMIPSLTRTEATLLCGVPDNKLGQMIKNASVGEDWVLIEGKVRHRGLFKFEA
mgnify:CR=1 FL=1